MIVYGDVNSGNCYKVKLLLEQLGLSYRWVPVDILNKETQTAAFLAKNPNGKIPLLETDDGRFLPESNAILYFLAQDSAYFPEDRFHRAQVLQWLFFEQYSHEPYIATARYIVRYLGNPAAMAETLASKRAPGHKALGVMESHLRQQAFFVGDRYSIADIALFAYTHVAPEGGFDLTSYPSVLAWINRVQAQPGFVPLG